jgi:hypothetical protein
MSEVLTLTYGYTAKDLAAVRAYVAPATIARTYCDPDEDSFAATPSAMERHLRILLDGLVKAAIEQGSPALAEHLRASVAEAECENVELILGLHDTQLVALPKHLVDGAKQRLMRVLERGSFPALLAPI